MADHRAGRSGGGGGAAGGEGGFDFVDLGLTERVNPKRDGFQDGEGGGEERECEGDAEEGGGGWHDVGEVAGLEENPPEQQAGEGGAGFDGEERGGVDEAGRAAAEFPFAVIGDVGLHRPHEGGGGAPAKGAEGLQRELERELMRGDKIKGGSAPGSDTGEGDGEDALVGDLGEETQAVGAEDLTGHAEGNEEREAVELAEEHGPVVVAGDVFEIVDGAAVAEADERERENGGEQPHHPRVVAEELLPLAPRVAFCPGGTGTRSLVLAKQMRNMMTASAAKISIVS